MIDAWSWQSKNIASTTLGAPLKGIKIERSAGGGFDYAPVEIEQRVFQPKMYWHPIPQSEILKLKQWKQNKGW